MSVESGVPYFSPTPAESNRLNLIISTTRNVYTENPLAEKQISNFLNNLFKTRTLFPVVS